MVYRRDLRIGMASVDAAGRIFYPELFRIVQACFEDFLRHLGMDIVQWLNEGDRILPVVHAEADYHHAIHLGDELEAVIAVQRIGETSITLGCDFHAQAQAGECVASARIVHVCVDKASGTAAPLPRALRASLAAWTSS